AFYTLGTVLKQQGKLQESADVLREALRLQPDFAGAHTTLAGVLRQLGDNDGAVAEAKAGAELAKRKTNLQAAVFGTNYWKRLRNAGDLDGAISQFHSAISLAGDFAPAHYELGLALLQQGKKEEAAKEFEAAHLLDRNLIPPAK